MSLSISYSKEIAKQLGQIAIYLPGAPVDVGDIITFPKGKSFLGKPRPLGAFQKRTSLKELGIYYENPKFSESPDTYKFSSSKNVDFGFDISANADLKNDSLPQGKAAIRISFSSEGAIYFLGYHCDKKQLGDLISIENQINNNSSNLLWEDTFLVTAITIAKKAFIAQSKSKSSSVIVNGNIKGLDTKEVNVNASTNLKITKEKGNVMIVDWSEDVTVFMDLIRFKKEIFGKRNYKNIDTTDSKVKEEFKISFKSVDANELLKD